MNEPEIALAGEADLRTMAARRCANDTERGLYLGFASHAPGGAWVARDAGEPVGICFAHAFEDEWFLSELFVEPSFRGQGVGMRLLREMTREAGDVWRSGLIEASSTEGMAFFLRLGVALRVPILELSGAIPKEDALAPLAAGDYRFGTVPIDASIHGGALAALDRETRGAARDTDHRLFTQHATGTLLLLNDEPVGYVYVWPDGRIGPMAAASAAYLTQFFGFALVAMRRTYGASWCKMLVPGNNDRLLRAAVRSGLAIDNVGIFASDSAMNDLSRYVGFHRLAF
jgi:GNAT superfamily N-acetyltransferase